MSKPTPISMTTIRRYVKRIVERFHPDAIYLFGSFANGTAHEDSDVDLMVVMPARNPIDESVRIRLDLPATFPMDLLVCTPQKWQRQLDSGDSFIREIATRGKKLHDARDPSMGEKGLRRLSDGQVARRRKQTAPRSSVLSLPASR